MYYSEDNIKKTTHKRLIEEFYDDKGDLVQKKERLKKIKKAKKGWCKMYPKDYADAMKSIADNPTAVKVWFHFIGESYFRKDGSIKEFTINKLAKELNISRQSISKAIKLLEQEGLIAKFHNELGWKYNPFIQGVVGQTDEDVALAQQKWDSEVGYYVFNKETKKCE